MLEISKTHQEKAIEIKDLIKDNLSLFILIPTILGGLLQVIQISYISPSLLRFFSLSQLITDGLFVILYFIIVVFLPCLLAYRVMSFSKNLSMFYRRVIVVIFIVLYLSCMLIKLYYSKEFNSNHFYDFLFQIFTSFIYGCGLFIRYPKTDQSQESKFEIQSFNLKLIIYGILYGIFLGYITFIQVTYTFPIDNFKVLEKKFEKTGKIKVLYFNDKYIFLEIDSKKKSGVKIHIEKLDSIF